LKRKIFPPPNAAETGGKNKSIYKLKKRKVKSVKLIEGPINILGWQKEIRM
jgi:hypothetical protein